MPSPNYFDLLNIAIENINNNELITAAYLRQQQKYHPDGNQKTTNQAMSVLINKAYAILSDPVGKYEYLLECIYNKSLNDIQIESEFVEEIMYITESMHHQPNTIQIETLNQKFNAYMEDVHLYMQNNNIHDMSHSLAKAKYWYNLIKKFRGIQS